MKTILNKSHRPLKIRLARGKILHLGPGHEGQVSTADAERESLLKLVADGDLEIVGDGVTAEPGSGSTAVPRLDTHGHHPTVAVKKRGER